MFFKKKKASSPAQIQAKKRDCVELFLARNRHHSRLSEGLYGKIYGLLIRRASEIMTNSGKNSEDIEDMLEHLLKLCNFRRGMTIPRDIDANLLQRYWEISTCSLVLMFLTRVVADSCIDVGIQVEHQGEIYTYSPYQDYLYENFKRIGFVGKNHKQFVMSSDVTFATRFNILNDLMYKSPMTMQWFGMFPDMLKLIYRHLEDKDEVVQGIYGSTVDRFVYEYLSKSGSDNQANTSLVEQGQVKDVVAKSVSPSTFAKPMTVDPLNENAALEVKRSPLVATPQMSGLFSKIKGSRPAVSLDGKSVSTAENLQCKKNDEEQGSSSASSAVSPLMQKLSLKLQTSTEESSEVNKGSDTVNHDIRKSFADIIRDISENDTLYKVVKPISRSSGEIYPGIGIMVTNNTYKVRLKKLGLEEIRHELVNFIKAERVALLSERKKIELNNGKEIVLIFLLEPLKSFVQADTFDISNPANVEFDDIFVSQ